MSILQNLTEGVVNRDLSKEGEAILNKWEKTGLLEGLEGDFHRNQMAVLLENQAKELLRESNTMAGGDVEGFAAVAFPIVRRVFGGLLAQKLVSVQPMSLPSGLVFFMDFVKQAHPSDADRDGMGSDDVSVYGGQKVGSEILGGVELDPEARGANQQTPQFQDLVHGHTVARGAASAARRVPSQTPHSGRRCRRRAARCPRGRARVRPASGAACRGGRAFRRRFRPDGFCGAR